jgi:hypothetical protein
LVSSTNKNDLHNTTELLLKVALNTIKTKPLKLWVRITLRRGVLNTTLGDTVFQWPAAGQWFSPGPPVSYTNKNDRHDITEILLKVALKYHKQIKPYYTMNSAIIFINFAAVCVHLELLETRDITSLKYICNSQLTVPLSEMYVCLRVVKYSVLWPNPVLTD